MAEFCTQCCADLDFEPDWKGLLPREEAAKGKSLGPMLCEICGVIWIDHEGRCLGCDIHPPVTKEQLIASAITTHTGETDER